MRRVCTYVYYVLKNKVNFQQHDIKTFIGKRVLGLDEINQLLGKMILEGYPFMVGRFGATELSTMRIFDFKIKSKYEKNLGYLNRWSGVFPVSEQIGNSFTELMLDSIPYVDIFYIWNSPAAKLEDYYIKRYGKKQVKLTRLAYGCPWLYSDKPWTAALKGKKVLVIHPFEDTIRSQYINRRELLFAGTDILPEFELYTLKAVQSLGDSGSNGRFSDWFEALEWMYQEAMKTDFEIALIGCGAYGFPLAVKLKQAGKQAVHLGGVLQVLFGIIGNRFEEKSFWKGIERFYNDSWVRPDIHERPANAQEVENGCYW